MSLVEMGLRQFCNTHRIFKEGGLQRFNPHLITEAVKSFNIGRGVECAKLVISGSGLFEKLGEDDYMDLFNEEDNRLCCASVGYKNHLANVLLQEKEGSIVNIYTSGQSLRIGGNSWENEPVLNRFYEEDIYTSAKQEKYIRIAFVRRELISPYKNVTKIAEYYAGKTAASLNFMSSHDRFKSVVALNKDEAYLVDHNSKGIPITVIKKNDFNIITRGFIENSYKQYERAFKSLAESHLKDYTNVNNIEIDRKTTNLVLRELVSDYMSEVEILPTTVFNDFCGMAVAGTLAKNASKYAEILTYIKENSIH